MRVELALAGSEDAMLLASTTRTLATLLARPPSSIEGQLKGRLEDMSQAARVVQPCSVAIAVDGTLLASANVPQGLPFSLLGPRHDSEAAEGAALSAVVSADSQAAGRLRLVLEVWLQAPLPTLKLGNGLNRDWLYYNLCTMPIRRRLEVDEVLDAAAAADASLQLCAQV
jgi:hypothetical protein